MQEKQSVIHCLSRERKALYLLIKREKKCSQGNADETIEMVLLETLVTVRLQCNTMHFLPLCRDKDAMIQIPRQYLVETLT